VECIYRIIVVLKVKTDIITGISVSLTGRSVRVVIMYFKTFQFVDNDNITWRNVREKVKSTD